MRSRKTLIKLGGASLLLPLIVLWELVLLIRPRPFRARVRILYFHAVPDDAASSFDRQMRLLAIITRVIDAASTRPIRSRRPLFAITFDDAFQSVGRNALPILEQLAFPTTIFAPTGILGEHPNWYMKDGSPDRTEIVMSMAELAGISAQGVVIGSHSVSHPHLSQLPDEKLQQELTRSLASLKALPGCPVRSIAFPYGNYDDRVVRACRLAGYSLCFSINPRLVLMTHDYLRGRIAVDAHDSLLVFLLKASGATSWPNLFKHRQPSPGLCEQTTNEGTHGD